MRTVLLLVLLCEAADGFRAASHRLARASAVRRAVVSPAPSSERVAASGRGIAGITLSPEVSSRGRPQSAVLPRELADVSERLRGAKAGWVVVGDAPLLAPVVEEQRLAAGLFPGPCPVVFRDAALVATLQASTSTAWDAAAAATALQTAVLYGADAVVVPVGWGPADPATGAYPASLNAATLEGVAALAAAAKPLGVAVIPELTCPPPAEEAQGLIPGLPAAAAAAATAAAACLTEAQSSTLLAALAAAASSNSVLVGSNACAQLAGGADAAVAEKERRADAAAAAADAAAGVAAEPAAATGKLPAGRNGAKGAAGAAKVASGSVRKALTVVGVVAVPPGQDMLKAAVKSLEARGFAGALLAAEVVPPGLPMSSMGRYWAAASNNIRSKASAAFQVRLKSFANEGPNKPDAWQEYMKMTAETGLNAAGDARDADAANAAAEGGGDWSGF